MYINVLEYLQEAAASHPHKIAFIDSSKSITFKELQDSAQRLATVIINRSYGVINRPIAVFLDKGIDSIVAFMAIAYSGCFYTPIDIKSPPERIKRIFEILGPEFIITNAIKSNFIRENQIEDKALFLEDSVDISVNTEAIAAIQKEKIDVDPLYVLFTSGSTGIPKGVIINHRSVIDYIEWVSDTFNINTDTVFGNQAPLYFDNSILDIYCTLKNSCTTVIIPEELFIFPKRLLQFIKEKSINTIFWVPSALIGVANSGALEDSELSIEKVLFCGEVMPNKQLNIWRRNYPRALYANLYGPTEITDVCTYYIVNRAFKDTEPLPIGASCRNTAVLVLNEFDQLVVGEEVGELCVRGTSLSLGYYNDPIKTNAAFVQNPLNRIYSEMIYRTGDLVKYNEYGELVYICRKDYQIKHMGHRIELGEIENAANSNEGMKHCCAMYDDEAKKIVLFASVDAVATDKAIYQHISKLLPRYMLPSVIKIINDMPMNANGKIDRAKLRKAYMEGKSL